MQLIGIQIDIAWEDAPANYAKVTEMLERNPGLPAGATGAGAGGGSIVALPEMFSSGFSMNVGKIAEDESQRGERFLCETAKRFGIYLLGGLVTRGSDGRGRNEAIVAGPGGDVVARYCKIHPYAPGKEAEHYCAGDEIVTFPCGEFTVAPFVCYDLRFPEIFRTATTRGANLMVVIASWPSPRVDHWTTLLKARAIENQSYVLGVNRCGKDPYLPYPGKSVIYDPRGNVLADAGSGEGIISAEADLATLTEYRRELPFLGDMRKEFLPL